MNTFNMTGHLADDPELRETETTTVTRFRLAVRGRKGTTDFFTIACFGKTAEAVAGHTAKGSAIAVTGRLTDDRYEDANGDTQYRVGLVANDVTFIGKKPGTAE